MKNVIAGQFGGFTLIELLVVVLIIGILAAVAVPQYTKAVEKSRAVQAITLVKSIRDAAEVYYMANGAYPQSIDDLDVSRPASVQDFEWDGSYEWRYGRFSLRHIKDPVYYIIASGTKRTSPSLNMALLADKIYCAASSQDGIKVCRSVGQHKVENVGVSAEFWAIE